MAVKRSSEAADLDTMVMARSLIYLSHTLRTVQSAPPQHHGFECKTCNRKFPSFQALGGHRASHKRPVTKTILGQTSAMLLGLEGKPKRHDCSICGAEFSLGQALGGHMRRHRAPALVSGSSKVPALMRSGSATRVFGIGMDLNLTPLENDLKFLFGNMAPKVSV